MEKIIPFKTNDLEENLIKISQNMDISMKSQKSNQKRKKEQKKHIVQRLEDKEIKSYIQEDFADYKTQVMPSTISGDHRTRLPHTLEVEQIAVSIANALKLNADLVSAIALGHDVGHTPFGHAAERKLNELLRNNGGFHHPIQSVRYIWEKYRTKIEPVIYEGILLHDSDMFNISQD